jgi:hypothetical protein
MVYAKRMNDMTPIPRHKQTPISFRSDKAAALLAELTRDGKSQAQVIEEALAKVADEKPKLSREEFMARLDAISERAAKAAKGQSRLTYQELRVPYYDENGLPI